MKNSLRTAFLLLAATALMPIAASAAPVYVTGNECPIDALVPNGGSGRQYSVTQSIRCMYDLSPSDDNPTGTTAEANLFLNTAAANTAGWGTAATTDNWVGLGGNEGAFPGFTYTQDAQGRNGTFTLSIPLTSLYDQFALAVKDGGSPKFAIFELPIGVFTGNWLIESSGGNLSHLALYGRNVPPCIPGVTNPDCPTGTPTSIDPVPEPTTLVLLGSGLIGVARKYRRRKVS